MKRILVVEDEIVTRKILCTVLGNFYEVVEAVDGTDALNKTDGVDLIICDYYMPQMNGPDFLQSIKDRKIPAIMLTMETDMAKRTEGKNYGVVAWITKPFVPDFILGQVRAVFSA